MTIEVNSVNLDYPIYGFGALSLKKSMLGLAVRTVGGGLLANNTDKLVVRALQNISFKLDDGDRLALIGHNGAGKSTLLRCLAGLYPVSSGRLSVKGNISTFFDIGLGLDPEATGRKNIQLLGLLKGMTLAQIKQKEAEIITFSGLGEFIDLPSKTYSSGMIGRLIFSVATASEPDVLLMDEWLSAGDNSFIEAAANRVESMVTKSRIMVLASHSPSILRRFCNKGMVLERGKITYYGSIDEAMTQYYG